ENAGTIPAESKLAARFAAFQSFRYGVAGQLEKSVRAARAAQAIQERTQLTDEWNAAVPLILMRVYSCLDDFAAVEREAAAALAAPEVSEPARVTTRPPCPSSAARPTGARCRPGPRRRWPASRTR